MRIRVSEKYYDTTPHLLNVYDREARKMAFCAKSEEEYIEWKAVLRAKFREVSGMSRLETSQLKSQLVETTDMGDYVREKVLLQTEPDVWMPVYVLKPKQQDAMRRCLIAAHGHDSCGKYAVTGRMDIPAVRKQIEHYNYAYGVELVRRGYMVFCPDARGFGERREWGLQGAEGEDMTHSTCSQLNRMAICLGLSLGGMWVWDLQRLIDYIETRTDCDVSRLGCVGMSGGGYQTLMLTAMDDRIKCAVVSGYFYGVRDALLKLSNNCDCNYIPNLWRVADMGDFGALIAPRPLLVETGRQDPLNGERGVDNVYEQVEVAKSAYQLLKSEEKLVWAVFEGEHRWYGDKTYDFINENL